MKSNDLLAKEIQKDTEKVRYKEPIKKKERIPIFYLIIVTLVTLSVLLALLRYL